MANSFLEELETPHPPYRMARLAATKKSTGSGLGAMEEAFKAAGIEQPSEAEVEQSPEQMTTPEQIDDSVARVAQEAKVQAPPKSAEIEEVQRDYRESVSVKTTPARMIRTPEEVASEALKEIIEGRRTPSSMSESPETERSEIDGQIQELEHYISALKEKGSEGSRVEEEIRGRIDTLKAQRDEIVSPNKANRLKSLEEERKSFEDAIQAARASGDEELAKRLEIRLKSYEDYESKKTAPPSEVAGFDLEQLKKEAAETVRRKERQSQAPVSVPQPKPPETKPSVRRQVGEIITEGGKQARVLEVNEEGRPTRLETIEEPHEVPVAKIEKGPDFSGAQSFEQLQEMLLDAGTVIGSAGTTYEAHNLIADITNMRDALRKAGGDISAIRGVFRFVTSMGGLRNKVQDLLEQEAASIVEQVSAEVPPVKEFGSETAHVLPSPELEAARKAANSVKPESQPLAPEQEERRAQEARARKEEIALKSAVTKAQTAAIKENKMREASAPDESLDILREAQEGRGPISRAPETKEPQEDVLDVLREGQTAQTMPEYEVGSERVNIPSSPETEATREAAKKVERPQEEEKAGAHPMTRREFLGSSEKSSIPEPVRAEEEPEPSGAEEDLEKIPGIKEMGEDHPPRWWDRIGLNIERSQHDLLAWVASVRAKKAERSLERKEKKVKELEKEAQELADKNWLGALWSPIKYSTRISWYRWREDKARAALERHQDSQERHESVRNEVLNIMANQFDTALKTHEARAQAFAEESDVLNTELDDLDAALSAVNAKIAVERNSEKREKLIAIRDAIMKKYESATTTRAESEANFQSSNARAIRLQRIKNQILKKATRSRAVTRHHARKRTETRRKTARAGQRRVNVPHHIPKSGEAEKLASFEEVV